MDFFDSDHLSLKMLFQIPGFNPRTNVQYKEVLSRCRNRVRVVRWNNNIDSQIAELLGSEHMSEILTKALDQENVDRCLERYELLTQDIYRVINEVNTVVPR